MKKIITWVRQHRYAVAIILLMVVAAILRFYLYPMRWGLAYDQAHDAIIARYALEHAKIPLLGPFSSAGPFQTGGEWYWFIMLGILVFPFWIQGPWILLTLTQVLFVGVMIYIGKELVNKKASLLIGLLVAFSPSEISQSTNLTNQGPISLLSASAILAVILFVKKRSSLSIFLLGLFVSLATSIHMEGATLFALIVLTVLLTRPSLKHIFLLILGILIPLTPIFVAEMHYGFFNTKGFLQYYLHDQYKIPLEMLGRRWTTYAGVIWPNTIAGTIGGLKPFGYLVIALWLFAVPLFFVSTKVTKYWVIIISAFFLFIIALRYVHTPLFDSYFMFAHPFMFILTGVALYALWENKKSRVLGVVLLLLILGGNIFQTVQIIEKSDNWTNHLATSWNTLLAKDYPNQKLSMYDYEYRSSSVSFPLVLYLQYNHKIDVSGYNIAFGKPIAKEDPIKANLFPDIKNNTVGFSLLDAQSSTAAQLNTLGWIRITPEDVYNATQEWYKK